VPGNDEENERKEEEREGRRKKVQLLERRGVAGCAFRLEHLSQHDDPKSSNRLDVDHTDGRGNGGITAKSYGVANPHTAELMLVEYSMSNRNVMCLAARYGRLAILRWIDHHRETE
jgi:hypothetical protein